MRREGEKKEERMAGREGKPSSEPTVPFRPIHPWQQNLQSGLPGVASPSPAQSGTQTNWASVNINKVIHVVNKMVISCLCSFTASPSNGLNWPPLLSLFWNAHLLWFFIYLATPAQSPLLSLLLLFWPLNTGMPTVEPWNHFPDWFNLSFSNQPHPLAPNLYIQSSGFSSPLGFFSNFISQLSLASIQKCKWFCILTLPWNLVKHTSCRNVCKMLLAI